MSTRIRQDQITENLEALAVAKEFEPGFLYQDGALIFKDDNLLRCNEDHEAGHTIDNEKWNFASDMNVKGELLSNKVQSISTTWAAANADRYPAAAVIYPLLDKTLFVSTVDGNDEAAGNNRNNSLKTVAAAIARAGNASHLTLAINASKTVVPAYASANEYAVGALVTSGGYVWERVTAGTGTTPSVTATVWRFKRMESVTRGAWSASAVGGYAVGDTVTWSNGTQTLSYVCMTVQAQGAVQSPANATNKFWALATDYNPVIPSTTITNRASLIIQSTDALTIIFTAALNLSQNKWLQITAPINVAGTMTLNYLGAYYISGTVTANVITGSYCGMGRFQAAVTVFAYIAHTSVGLIVYYSTVTIHTDNLTRAGIALAGGTRGLLYNTVTINAFVTGGANTGIGINLTHGTEVETLGNVTATGFGTAILVDTGCTYYNCSTTTTMAKGSNSAAAPIAFNIGATGILISSRRTAYVRTSTADTINATATILDYKKLANSNLLGFA